MFRITFEFENSPDDLEAVIAAANALRNLVAGPVPQPAANAPATAWNVASWFGHLGTGSQSFWSAAARHAQTHATWTFDDLAAASGTDKETLRSYHRNSYRAIGAANAPDPLQGQWDTNRGCNVYTMPDAVRDEILRIA